MSRTRAVAAGNSRTLGARMSSLLLKPPDPSAPPPARPAPRSVEELEDAHRYADDKERLIGLLGAPFAAAIAVLVVSALVAHDPLAKLKDGLPNPRHVSPSLYMELLGVLVALALVMLATAWLRKRLFLGCAMALYGLAVFNMHYWGFGVPFVMVGAWLLVRAYRAQRDLREATGTGPATVRGTRPRMATVPEQSKRYTPPGGRRRA